MDIITSSVLKIFILALMSFGLAILWTPLLTFCLYKYKLGKTIRTGDEAPVYQKLHAHKSGTPTMGGVLIWGTTLFLSLLVLFVSRLTDNYLIHNLNFLTRSETLLPLGALVASAIVGLFDDLLNIKGIGSRGGGLRVRHKLVIYTLIALVGAYWFYFKLDWDLIRLPFLGNYFISWWYIPIFIIIIVATSFSVNETDGLAGLAGGALLAAFSSYAVIAFVQGRYNLAAFCSVIVGSLLAFLWFNINPARFIMGDTGSMALGVTLGIVALLTNTVFLLPIIGFLFVVESLSVIIQVSSKKLRHGKKIFISTPIHHHFEAIGWSEPKIVMRFWIISGVMVVLGLIIFLVDYNFFK